ncbi:MAG: TonB-dependent receptor [Parvibaculum sp.]|uniref:TonB-dependent receptor n=1 Tax=Parvibaculum sp. TaxID=2024848 RepID=UPI00271E4867|nr:TonB-dependent receptor [Parvibaculum sp.]MDO8837315.1 TonB-dependent receptor [Parvibaculum sp.]
MKRFASPLYAAASVIALGAGSPALAEEAVAPTVFVTASPLASPLDELAAPVTVVTREEILASPATSIGGLLADKPGIAASSFAAGASRPIIRGLDNTRVRVQENGIGAGDVSTVSEDHGVPIDPLSARRVEVVRGPAVLRYGSEAIGGVVNVINNRIPTTMPKGGIEGEVSASYNHVDYGRQGYADLNVATGNVVWHVDTFARKTGNYQIPDQPTKRQHHTWTESAGVAGGASVLLENGHIGASVSHYDSDYGIPAPENPGNPIHIEMRQTKLQASSELEFASGFFSGLDITGGYSDYSHGEIDATGATGSRFDNKEWEVRGELLHRAVGPFTGAVGLQLRNRQIEAAGEGGELLAPTETDAVAGFIFEEMPLGERLKLQLGGRAEHVDVSGRALDFTLPLAPFDYAVSRQFTPVSGSAGLVLSLDGGVVLGATVQRVERAPDALELFSKGPHEATETFEVGDPTLGKEKARSIEFNARRAGDDFSFEAAIFHTSFSDFIYKRLTGETCDDDFDTCTPHGAGNELDQVFFTQEDATFRGFEAAGSVTLARWGAARAGITGQFDMVRATLDAGGNVPRIPPMRAGAGVFYAGEALSGKLGFLHAFAQDRIDANETETGSYTNLKAELRYRVPTSVTGTTPVELALIGENLLDHDMRHHSSFKKNDVLQPGRNVRLVATARF